MSRVLVLVLVWLAGCVVPAQQQYPQPQPYPQQQQQQQYPQQQPQYAQQQPAAASCQDTLNCYGQCNPLTEQCIGACDQRTDPQSQQNAHAVLVCIGQSGCQDQNCVAQHCGAQVQTCTSANIAAVPAQTAPAAGPPPPTSNGGDAVMQAEYDPYGILLIHPPRRVLTQVDLAGAWSGADKALSTYHTAGGRYDGFNASQVTQAWTIDARGQLEEEFGASSVGESGYQSHVSVRHEHNRGTVVVHDNNTVTFDYPAQNGNPVRTQHYIIAGWFVGPEVVLMQLVGPYYQPITQQDFNDLPHHMFQANIYMRKR